MSSCSKNALQRLGSTYSITSSARASSVGRTLRPNALGDGGIDDEIELGRLLYGKVRWLRPAQNLIDIVGHAPEQVREVGCIRHQTYRFDLLPSAVHRRNRAPNAKLLMRIRLVTTSGSLQT